MTSYDYIHAAIVLLGYASSLALFAQAYERRQAAYEAGLQAIEAELGTTRQWLGLHRRHARLLEQIEAARRAKIETTILDEEHQLLQIEIAEFTRLMAVDESEFERITDRFREVWTEKYKHVDRDVRSIYQRPEYVPFE